MRNNKFKYHNMKIIYFTIKNSQSIIFLMKYKQIKLKLLEKSKFRCLEKITLQLYFYKQIIKKLKIKFITHLQYKIFNN